MLRREKGFRYLKKANMLYWNFMKEKSSFWIHADFESISTPENNRKQNPDESHTNK